MTGTTEARPGIMTTEFWLSVIMAVTVIVAGYVSDAFDVDLAGHSVPESSLRTR